MDDRDPAAPHTAPTSQSNSPTPSVDATRNPTAALFSTSSLSDIAEAWDLVGSCNNYQRAMAHAAATSPLSMVAAIHMQKQQHHPYPHPQHYPATGLDLSAAAMAVSAAGSPSPTMMPSSGTRPRRPVDAADKQYICSFKGCGKTFYQKQTMRRHQREKHKDWLDKEDVTTTL